MNRVLICLSSHHWHNPYLLGLSKSKLQEFGFIQIETCAEEIRHIVATSDSISGVWVISSEEITPINLAATLKQDRPDVAISIWSEQESGSFKSRAYAAGLDGVFNTTILKRRFSLLCEQNVSDVSTDGVQEHCEIDSSVGQGVKSDTDESVLPVKEEASFDNDASDYMFGQKFVSSADRAKIESRVHLSEEDRAFLLPVISGNGGAGKSTISVLTALIAAYAGYKTLLIDLDLQFGNASTLLGRKDDITIDEILSNSNLVKSLEPKPGELAFIATTPRLELAELHAPKIPALLDQLRDAFEVVVVNTGNAWGELHAVLLEQATRVFFLINQQSSSLESARRAVDLCMRCGIACGPFIYLLNGCGKHSPFSSIDVSCMLHGSKTYELNAAGFEVEEMLGAGLADEYVYLEKRLAVELEQIVREVLPDYDSRQKEFSGLESKKPKRKKRRFSFFSKRRERRELSSKSANS